MRGWVGVVVKKHLSSGKLSGVVCVVLNKMAYAGLVGRAKRWLRCDGGIDGGFRRSEV